MAYDEKLAGRVRQQLGEPAGLTEKKMFGGVGFMLNGNLAVGVHGPDLIVRLDPAGTANALSQKHTKVFDLSGRPMQGWILVAPEGLATKAALGKWVKVGVQYAGSLPAK